MILFLFYKRIDERNARSVNFLGARNHIQTATAVFEHYDQTITILTMLTLKVPESSLGWQ